MSEIECSAVTPECPVEDTILGYYPILGVNAFFLGFFALCGAIQLGMGIRYKTWTYMTAVLLGCAGEAGGYAGRVLMHSNPWGDIGFNLQIVLLIFSPAFLAAGIYLSLKHIVIQFGESWSRLRPAWYTYIFIACDVSSLVMQSAGGALAATADDGSSLLDIGTNLMIAGIIWQVVILLVFAGFAADYSFRTYKRKEQLSASALALWNSRSFHLFVAGLVAAYVGILVRCIYRIPELVAGWGSELMRNEIDFIILEGVMIVISVTALTIFHPGVFFPALASGFGKPGHTRGKSVSDSDVEMMDRA
ncbi:RTA1 like protein-domain-containing protein [Massariosphaeria phaeospora]|uniref:RTA1 like protein-domain-containing protein n=1 Tax=Massariosphaeria phaeospora TaxID=100035 RepID=A0A7C8IDQ9_9PLEO|nr:RTA1 like protein-domain-containing protein [Massariosphaeria phaeospora]